MSIRCQGMGKFGPCTRSTKSGFCHDHIYIHNIHSHEERIEQMQQKAQSLGKLSQSLSEKLFQEAEMAKADPERYQLSEELFQDFDEVSNICSILQMLLVVKTKQSVLKGIHFLPLAEPQQEILVQTPVNVTGKCCHIHTRNGMAGQPCGRKVKHGNYCTQHAYHNNQKPKINSVVQSNRYFENVQSEYLPQAVMSQVPSSRQQNFGWNNSFLAPPVQVKTSLPIKELERNNSHPQEKNFETIRKNSPVDSTSVIAETIEEAPKTNEKMRANNLWMMNPFSALRNIASRPENQCCVVECPAAAGSKGQTLPASALSSRNGFNGCELKCEASDQPACDFASVRRNGEPVPVKSRPAAQNGRTVVQNDQTGRTVIQNGSVGQVQEVARTPGPSLGQRVIGALIPGAVLAANQNRVVNNGVADARGVRIENGRICDERTGVCQQAGRIEPASRNTGRVLQNGDRVQNGERIGNGAADRNSVRLVSGPRILEVGAGTQTLNEGQYILPPIRNQTVNIVGEEKNVYLIQDLKGSGTFNLDNVILMANSIESETRVIVNLNRCQLISENLVLRNVELNLVESSILSYINRDPIAISAQNSSITVLRSNLALITWLETPEQIHHLHLEQTDLEIAESKIVVNSALPFDSINYLLVEADGGRHAISNVDAYLIGDGGSVQLYDVENVTLDVQNLAVESTIPELRESIETNSDVTLDNIVINGQRIDIPPGIPTDPEEGNEPIQVDPIVIGVPGNGNGRIGIPENGRGNGNGRIGIPENGRGNGNGRIGIPENGRGNGTPRRDDNCERQRDRSSYHRRSSKNERREEQKRELREIEKEYEKINSLLEEVPVVIHKKRHR